MQIFDVILMLLTCSGNKFVAGRSIQNAKIQITFVETPCITERIVPFQSCYLWEMSKDFDVSEVKNISKH
jgi:hypothetical protein